MFKINRKLAVVTAATAAVLLGGGIAAAYWTASGTGTGSAQTSNTTLSITGTATLAPAGMFPGSGPHAYSVTLSNPNAYDVIIETLALAAVPVTVSDDAVPSHFVATVDAGQTGAAAVIAANSTKVVTGTIQLTNVAGNQDVDKGDTVTIHLSVNGGS